MKGPVFCCSGVALLILSALGALFVGVNDSSAEPSSEKMSLYFQGRYVFQKHCVLCHGRTGRGDGEFAKDVTTKPRNFRTGVFKFRTTAMGFLPTDDDLRRTIRSGVSGTMMPSFKKLSDSDVTAVISYLKVLSSRWGKPEFMGEAYKLPDVPAWYQKPAERIAHIGKGSSLFKVNCVICHGNEAKGNGEGGRALIDIWKDPIFPADLTQEHHKSGDSMKDLYRTVAMGLDGTPMLGYMEALGQESIWDLVAYIKSIEETGK